MKARNFLILTVFLLIFVWVFPPAVNADLDIGMPPGTPIEWDKDFPKPVPTPRGKVPAITEGYKRKQAEKNKPPNKHEHAGRTEPLRKPVSPPKMDFSVQNLYSYFGILTVDIMNHLKVKIPAVHRFPNSIGEDDDNKTSELTGKNVPKRAPGAASWIIEWNYQPEYPVELVWDAITCVLRLIMHPEVISFPLLSRRLAVT